MRLNMARLMPEISKIDCFDLDDIPERGIFLLACVRRDHEYEHYCTVLNEIQRRYSNLLKVGALDENAIETYRKLGIEGTPTFLIFQDRKEVKRILGRTTLEGLGHFVGRSLPIFGGKKEFSANPSARQMDTSILDQ
jgi:hypothetical protein